ncbi:uncharacterized protein CIMG_07511 [Coccidioides immitis RS]|uniref:Uncharacterized protein n=3 Tax=Coccidioides immitis TaxID=5501 RepID=J3K3J6_COCIM|nr:uncharacterized protein CIMG_07511 [Coccidioides immitis RS]EAS28765.3 hypothetical protein CIMG_07511 [Coccidioides immitis RS]KMP05870.1 hypothetical protein CIRG_05551 [Coccidioides immitis RMSCC 2394]KMU80699.1 hypothetical protein CISG_08763 [Coccidioides immitis RMSCC 3703]
MGRSNRHDKADWRRGNKGQRRLVGWLCKPVDRMGRDGKPTREDGSVWRRWEETEEERSFAGGAEGEEREGGREGEGGEREKGERERERRDTHKDQALLLGGRVRLKLGGQVWRKLTGFPVVVLDWPPMGPIVASDAVIMLIQGVREEE